MYASSIDSGTCLGLFEYSRLCSHFGSVERNAIASQVELC